MTRKSVIPPIFAEPFQTRPFLFLGYGLYDWNLRVILNRIQEFRGHPKFKSWAIETLSKPVERKLWEARGVDVYDGITPDEFLTESEKAEVRPRRLALHAARPHSPPLTAGSSPSTNATRPSSSAASAKPVSSPPACSPRPSPCSMAPAESANRPCCAPEYCPACAIATTCSRWCSPHSRTNSAARRSPPSAVGSPIRSAASRKRSRPPYTVPPATIPASREHAEHRRVAQDGAPARVPGGLPPGLRPPPDADPRPVRGVLALSSRGRRFRPSISPSPSRREISP